MRQLMFFLDLQAGQILLHIFGNVHLCCQPPIIRSQIHIHFARTWMYGEIQLMSLIQKHLPCIPYKRYSYTTIMSEQSLTIPNQIVCQPPNLFPNQIFHRKYLIPSLSKHIKKTGTKCHPQTSNMQECTMLLATQHISNNTQFTKMVEYLWFIILQHNEPPMLSHIQILLIYKIIHAPMISI